MTNCILIIAALCVGYLLGRSVLLFSDGKIQFDEDGERFIILFPEGKDPARYRSLLLRVVEPKYEK